MEAPDDLDLVFGSRNLLSLSKRDVLDTEGSHPNVGNNNRNGVLMRATGQADVPDAH